MLGDVAGRVGFDDEVEVAGVFVAGDGRVGADDFFWLVGDGRSEGYVLADGETEDVGLSGQRETVTNYF